MGDIAIIKPLIEQFQIFIKKRSTCKYSTKSCETFSEFLGQFAQILYERVHQRCLIGSQIHFWIPVYVSFTKMCTSNVIHSLCINKYAYYKLNYINK